MPLTNATAKEAEQSYQPVLLYVFQFWDGSYLRVSTHPLNSAEGGYAYGGNNYLARVSDQALGAIQERSEQGIERMPTCGVKLLDQDFYLWTNYESTLGFRSASLQVDLIYVDFSTAPWTFSSDTYNVFNGICDPPSSIDPDGTISIAASSSNNLQKKSLPIIPAQSRCSNTFPPDAASRLAGATDPTSRFSGCGYNPDQACTAYEGGSGQRGNYQSGSTPYTTCNLTRGDCVSRGMFVKDSSNRITGRFNGIEWVPPNTLQSVINYGSGNKTTALRIQNPGIAGKPVPIGYGTAWGAPLIANILGDGNYTRYEMVINGDYVGPYSGYLPVRQVVINGVTVPHNTGNASDKLNLGLRWDLITTGARSGAPTLDAGYNGQGDPYGGMAMVYPVIFVEVAQSNAAPNANVLADRTWIRQPNTTTSTLSDILSWPYSFTRNPIWIVMNMLTRSGLRYADLILQTFITEAAWANQTVSYVDNNGATSTHARYICGFYLNDFRVTSELLNAVLRGCNAQLYRDKATGLVGIIIRKSIADQQSAPIDGSNYNTSIAAVHADGTSGYGYVAYAFDESNTLSIRTVMSPNANTGNRITIPIEDEDNGFVQDTCIITDTDDAGRGVWANSGSVVNSNFVPVGIQSFDQAFRVGRLYLAEQLRGNEQQDTRGTRRFEIRTTHRISHLRVGQIVMCRFVVAPNSYSSSVSLQSPPGTAIPGFLARVIKIEGTKNFEGMTVTVEWTESSWYADAYGQSKPPQYSDPRKHPPARPPYPWQPHLEGNNSNDPIYAGVSQFSCALGYAQQADGSAMAVLSYSGRAPANILSTIQPPQVALQGQTANTGGFIAPGTYFVVICAIDSAGLYSAPSTICTIVVPAGTTTNTVTIPIYQWDPASVNSLIFIGTSELLMSRYGSGTGSVGGPSFTITALSVGQFGPPDTVFHHFRTRAKKIDVPAVWQLPVSTVGTYTLQFTGQTWTTNQFAGRVVSLMGAAAGGRQPIYNATVVSNTADTLTVDTTTSSVIFAGDVIGLRPTATSASANTVTDSLLAMTVNAQGGNLVRIIGGTGRGQPPKRIVSNTATALTIAGSWDIQPDSTSIFIVEEPNWFYDVDSAPITNADPAHSAPAEIGEIPIANIAGSTVLIEVLTEDANEASLGEWAAPFREMYIFGNPGISSAVSLGYQTATLDGSNHFVIDLANGFNWRIVLTSATATGSPATTIASIPAPIYTGGTIQPGMFFTLYVDQDSTGGWPLPGFQSGPGGFTSDVPSQSIDGTPTTRSVFQFGYHADGTIWGLEGDITTGRAIS